MTTPGLAPDRLRTALQHDSFWSHHIDRILQPEPGDTALHLAILVNPYLQLLLTGQKTIESRFSLHRRAPFNQIDASDVVLLKRSGGPILGIGLVARTRFLTVTPQVLEEIKTSYSAELGIRDPAFWEARASSGYATLLWLEHVTPIEPLPFQKRDQRAWVVLKRRTNQQTLWNASQPGYIPVSASD